jgi:hypothetical protein
VRSDGPCAHDLFTLLTYGLCASLSAGGTGNVVPRDLKDLSGLAAGELQRHFFAEENTSRIEITLTGKILCIQERGTDLELRFGEESIRLEQMTVRQFINRMIVGRLIDDIGNKTISVSEAKAVLAQLDLGGTSFMGLETHMLDLSGLDMSGVNLAGCMLAAREGPFDLRGTNLEGANLHQAYINGQTRFDNNTVLTNARMTELSPYSFCLTDLSQVIHLTGTVISMKLDSEENLDLLLLEDENDGYHLAAAIERIPARFDSIRNTLVSQLVLYLKESPDFHPRYLKNLLPVLRPEHTADPRMRDFLMVHIKNIFDPERTEPMSVSQAFLSASTRPYAVSATQKIADAGSAERQIPEKYMLYGLATKT